MLPENVAKVDPLIQSFGLSKRSQYSTHLYGGMILDLVFDILNFNTVSSLRSPYSDHFVCIFVIIYIYIYNYIITLLHNWYRWLLHLDWMCFWAVIITLFLFFGYNFVFFSFPFFCFVFMLFDFPFECWGFFEFLVVLSIFLELNWGLIKLNYVKLRINGNEQFVSRTPNEHIYCFSQLVWRVVILRKLTRFHQK